MITPSKLALFRIFAALLGVFGLLHLMGFGRDYPFISIGFFSLVVVWPVIWPGQWLKGVLPAHIYAGGACCL